MLPDRILALSAVTLLSAVFLFALKSRALNGRILPLARQFRWHHLLALACSTAIVVHVATSFWRDWPDSAAMYTALSDPAVAAGWLAFLLLGVATSTSYFPKVSWRRWYALHLLVLPALASLAYHSLEYAKTRPVDFSLLLSLFLVMAGITILIVRNRFTTARSGAFKVTEIHPVNGSIFELHLEADPAQRAERFAAGSIVYVRFVGSRFTRKWHPFSVASCRYESNVRLLIKGIGADTRLVANLRKGDALWMRGPYREFTPDFTRPQIWIAGGVGIAPFAGYAACLAHLPHAGVSVFHFFEQPQDTLSVASFVQARAEELHQVNIVNKPGKLPDLTPLLAEAARTPQAQYLVCGPPRFMRWVRKSLRHAGVMHNQIETEEFLPW